MDEIIRFQVDHKEFSGSVLVASGDHIVLSKAYGMANIEWNIPNTPATRFRIGSVTKQFTAAAILLLEDQGKLKIDDRPIFCRTPAPIITEEQRRTVTNQQDAQPGSP